MLGAGRAVTASWGAGAVAAIRSPAAVAAAMGALPGNLGRYVGGNGATVDQAATESSLLDTLTANRQVVSANVAALADATDATVLATAILAVPESVRTSIADPAGQIAVLTPLATYDASVVASDAPIGGAIATVQTATATLCRQAALLSLANACADWHPSSSNDAQAMRTRIGGMLDDAATAAADAGSDATFQALRSLRAQVLQDLANRGARMPDVITVTRNAPLPALVLAQQLYANGGRACDRCRGRYPQSGRYLSGLYRLRPGVHRVCDHGARGPRAGRPSDRGADCLEKCRPGGMRCGVQHVPDEQYQRAGDRSGCSQPR
ncbi:hypothetical protein [Novacetimonas pomaceti]|uniref:hypothetical protein n=1 Tax=Novacetimonas pomaceti TaxID=2021998 RepID=UPI001EEFE83F|nr:hypothetical protein [Novacetimonas pomaceti]